MMCSEDGEEENQVGRKLCTGSLGLDHTNEAGGADAQERAIEVRSCILT